MGKKQKTLNVGASKARKSAASVNPFEMKKTKTRFDVLGRSLKGAATNVVKARTDAVKRRKSSLLIEYKAMKKANTFTDRRFGQNDSKMSEEDKAFIRLQAHRVKKSHHDNRLGGGGKKVKFSLGHEDGEDKLSLTHLGKSISEAEVLDEAPAREDDVDEQEIEEMMRDYNFGGGEEGRGPDGKPKSRKEVMEEIIAKSRMFKAQRQKQKEDDLEEMQKLDSEYKDLLHSQALTQFIKPKGHGKDNKIKADNKQDQDYDVAARELAFEAKGAATDRTLAPEEAAEKEKQRLELLEKERIKRMKGSLRPLNDDEEDGLAAGLDDGLMGRGGYAARRAKVRAKQGLDSDEDDEGDDDDDDDDDDNDNDNEEEEEDEEGKDRQDDDLTRRRMTRAAGDHPLQSALREKAAELAGKYGLGKIKNPMIDSDGEDDEGEEEEDEEEDGNDDVEEEEENGKVGNVDEEEDDRDKDDEEEEDDDDYERELRDLKGEISRPSEPSLPRQEQETSKSTRRQEAQASELEAATLDLPFTLPVPETYEKFHKLVDGRPPDQLTLAIQRIRAFNSSELASDNKRKLQVLYGILVQHFAHLSGQVPIPSSHLDAMLPSIIATTAEVPFYAAMVARTRLLRLNDRLSASLAGTAPPPVAPPNSSSLNSSKKKDKGKEGGNNLAALAEAPQESSWPPPRALLQLKLFLTLYPLSDKRHPVLTPVSLFIGRALSQCLARDIGEVVRGLFLSSLALSIASSASRHYPEALSFLVDVLQSFAGRSKAKERSSVALGVLAPVAKGKALSRLVPSKVNLYESLTLPAGNVHMSSDSQSSDEFKLGLLSITLSSISLAMEIEASSSSKEAYPEIANDVCAALMLLEGCHLPPSLERHRVELLEKINRVSLEAVDERQPLSRPASSSRAPGSAAQVNREFNPRFEDGFVKGRDYDPDRERALDRKAKRVAAKEKRGKMREMRKDSLFLSDQRDKEKAQVDKERMESQRSFYSILEKQASDLKSGGQGGGVKRKRK